MEQHVNEWLEHLRSLTWDNMKTKVKDYLQLAKTRWTVWDPRRGEYAFQVGCATGMFARLEGWEALYVYFAVDIC